MITKLNLFLSDRAFEVDVNWDGDTNRPEYFIEKKYHQLMFFFDGQNWQFRIYFPSNGISQDFQYEFRLETEYIFGLANQIIVELSSKQGKIE